MNIKEAKKQLDALIVEIEDEASFLNEHSCTFAVEDLKRIRKLLD